MTFADDPGDPGEPPGTEDRARSPRLLADAQALAHLGAWEWDAARRQLQWSDELYRILGLAPGAVEPSFEALLARVHADDAADVRRHLARAEREAGPLSLEYRIVRPTGEIRTLQSRVQSTFDGAGALIRILGADQDLTDTKELAARLVFSDRMVSVGTLAGGMAHEINNPLATISAYIDLLAEYPEARESETLVEEARAAIDRIQNIMRGMAAFSRAGEDLRAPLDVERVLELALGMASPEIRHRARLVKEYSGTPPVAANEARLGHVFLNLLVNAAEAIPEGQSDRHEIRVTTRTDAAGWAVVEIRDTGAGVPQELQDRIFDPFFTTKPVGKSAGLGLSIAHGIVRSLGGEILLRSEPGQGSTFSISLPPVKDAKDAAKDATQDAAAAAAATADAATADAAASPAPAAAPAAPAARPPAPPAPRDPDEPERHGHVLIVDDEIAFANSLRRLLSNEHAVSIVANGREALARVQQGDRFDVILCDLMMPEMTGSDLYAALTESAPDQASKIIFITGGAFSPASQRFLERVPNPCFEKPCDIQKLRSAIRQQIAGVQS